MREKLILQAVESGLQRQIESARTNFSKDDVTFCPYCYQDIDKEYKELLVTNINKVLNHEVEAHIEELRRIVLPRIELNTQNYVDLDSDLTQKISDKITAYNKNIVGYEKLIVQKCDNTYIPITADLSLAADIRELNKLLDELEKSRKEYLDASKRKTKLQNDLIKINKLIVSKAIEEDYKNYIAHQEAQKALQTEVAEKAAVIRAIEDKIAVLNDAKRSTGIAIPKINRALEYIFFSKDRLSIELKDDTYYLKSNGKDVRPKDISCSERNIIALCYFFTEIVRGQEISNLYEKEQFLVIDDPISSFDFENKIGIASYLKSQLQSIIFGNSNSKIIIMSHDLTTIFDLQKAADEICKAYNSDPTHEKTNRHWVELSEKRLIQFEKKHSEYTELMSKIFAYADSKSEVDALSIGNYMRRALEAFSTFLYKKGIGEISSDKGVLGELEDKSDYFEHLMYRLVLHGESHSEERIKSLHSDNHFFDYISDDEKQKTARSILCFMYLLNPRHVEAHVGVSAKEKIKKWCEQIPLNSVPETLDIEDSDVNQLRVINLYDLPASAGTGNYSLDDIPHTKYETSNERCNFAVKIDGDSMEPDIPNGSIVLVKSCEDLPEGAIGVFLYDGNLYCKIREYIDGDTYLMSLNSKYELIRIQEDIPSKIQGQVIEIVVH